ncbi:MAG TPA: VWA domain-containing protein [Firmicutes bacterium]|nr:VWA domain-containing protein [Bacillota bacterium]
MSFYNLTYLVLLALVPLILLGFWAQERNRRIAREKFAPEELIVRFASLEPIGRSVARAVLIAIALLFLLVAFARPQGGERILEEDVEGIEIVLALDVSRSMLARDLYPTRLDAIKNVVKRFVDSSLGDRIGVVAFAGDAVVTCPLTADHGTVSMYVDRLDTEQPIRPGTAIGNAIRLSVNRFSREDNTGKVIILLTDGENNKGIDPLTAAQEAKDAGIRIYTVGIGTEQGAQLPESDTQPFFGGPRFRTDSRGNPITVGLDIDMLKQIASMTGGRYFSAANQMEVNTLYNRIAHEGQTQFQTRKLVRRDELAPYFLLLACLFLIMEAFYTYISPASAKEVRRAKPA